MRTLIEVTHNSAELDQIPLVYTGRIDHAEIIYANQAGLYLLREMIDGMLKTCKEHNVSTTESKKLVTRSAVIHSEALRFVNVELADHEDFGTPTCKCGRLESNPDLWPDGFEATGVDDVPAGMCNGNCDQIDQLRQAAKAPKPKLRKLFINNPNKGDDDATD